MSSSNRSPQSDSSQSQVPSDRFDILYKEIGEEKEKMNSKTIQAIQLVNKSLGSYELYVKLLLGREVKKKDEHKFKKKWGNFINEIEENLLPEAILKFPNPDSDSLDLLEVMEPTNAILFIQKVLKLDMKKVDNQIFMKAIEGVYSKLLPCVKKGRKRFGFHQNSNFKSQSQLDALLQQREEIVHTPFESILQRIPPETTKKMDPLNSLVLQMQHKLIGSDVLNVLQNKGSEQFDIDYSLFKEMKPRLMQKGGFFNKNNNKWVRSGEDTSDFLTLMRHIMLIRVMVRGFSVSSRISDDGKFIFCRLYAHEENLKTLAEKQRMKKKLNFQFTDLFSLEPVDFCYRPLRLNNRLWKPSEYDDVTDMFLYLRPKIIKLINEINFKRVSREINQNRINGQLFQYGKLDLQDDEDQPNDEQWFAYYQYLVHLEKEVSQFRQSFKIDSDLAAIINKQISPFHLYLLRNKKNPSIKGLTDDKIKEAANKHHQQELKKIAQRTYQIIQEYSHLIKNEIPNTKIIKMLKKERLANNYFRSFEEALKVANTEKQLLFTIWDLIKVPRLEPYSLYSKPSLLISPKMQMQKIMCWCKYQINEFKKVSLFSISERLKLTDQAINNLFQLNDLINSKVVAQFFCLNDHYELFGHLDQSRNEVVIEDDYYRNKMYHLEFEWSFNIREPWSTPIDLICEYYGEKIGLYFYYQTYYTKMLLKIAFIALGCNLVQWLVQGQTKLNALLRILFAFLQIQWTNLFVVLWQKEQIIFNLKFGQSGKDEIQVERSNFVGKIRRSVENDQLNSTGVDETELYTRMMLATLILIFLIGFYAGIMIGLYALTLSLQTTMEGDPKLKGQTFEVMVTASLNIVIIQFLDKVYNAISISLTDFENQKTVKDYEESFVGKKYILYFISYVGPLIIIAYLNGPFDLYCKETYCQSHIEYHFATMIIWIFFFKTLSIFKLIYHVKKIPIFRYSFSEQDIHKYIQEQSERKSYAISQERYGTLEDYMEIFLQNTLLSIFGYSFPFSFFLLWVQNIAQMQADRAKFVYFLQRPWPQNNSSLGVWNKILELINYVCILTNTGQMTLQYYRTYGYEIILVYLMFLICNFAMNFIMNGTFGQIPYELTLFMQRQKYLIRNTLEKFSKNQTGGQLNKQVVLSRFPILKIFGMQMDCPDGIFETVSSEDELRDHFEVKSINQQLRVSFLKKKLQDKKTEEQKKKENKKNDELTDRNKKKEQQIDSKKKIIKQGNNKSGSQQNLDTVLKKKKISLMSRKKSIIQLKNPSSTTNLNEIRELKTNQNIKSQQKLKLAQEIGKQFSQQDQILSDEFMQYHFETRIYNWAYEIKYWKRTQVHTLNKALRFLYQKFLLSTHKNLWCDQRIVMRSVYLKRKIQYFRDIDLRKLRIYKKNIKIITESVKTKAKQKFRQQFKMINPNSQRDDDIKELSALQQKFNKYVEKHAQLESTKVVVVKVKGIWFNQFRKQTVKQRSIDLALKYRTQTKIMRKLKDDQGLTGQLDKAIGKIKLDKVTLSQLITAFSSIHQQTEYHEIPLCTKPINIFSYYRNKKKSEIYTTVIDKFKDTYIFDYQFQKLQQVMMQYFEEELFSIPSIKLQRQLSECVWIAFVDGRQQLIQFLQIRHEQKLRINPYCSMNLGVYYVQGIHHVRLSNIIDQIDDFYIKGYCVIQYDIMTQYTLKNILKYRSTYGLNYSLTDLYEFLHANLLLLKQQSHGEININNYYLDGRSYVLLQTQKEGNDMVNLAQVIIEMILLRPVETPISGYQQLYTLHPLRPLLMEMIYESPTIDEIVQKIPNKHSFMEYNINQDERYKTIKVDENIHGQLALATHQINFSFRLKLFDDTIEEISSVEEFLLEKKFIGQTQLIPAFLEYLIVNQNQIISKPSEIKLMNNVLLIIYIKFATLLQKRKNFLPQMEPLQAALTRSIQNIDDLIKQTLFNVKLEQLSSTEQKVLLRRRLTRSKSLIDLQAKDRLQLITKIRKHPHYMKVVMQLKKELMRYSLQFQTLQTIHHYFNLNFQYSAQMLEDVVKSQLELIQQERNISLVAEEPQDLSPSQFNFNQQSPTLDATLRRYHEKKIEIKQEFYESPNYCSQLLFYRYLYLTILYDGGNEYFHTYFIDYLEEKIESPVYEYYASQLQVMKKYEIPEDYLNFNRNCEIGKFIVVTMNKWIEQSYLIPSQLVYSNHIQFQWKQVVTYSVIEQSLNNRQILIKLLNQKATQLSYILMEIRAIHHILHIDNYQPLEQHLSFEFLDISDLNYKFLQNSFINRLKVLHNLISIESDSWFHSKGLLQFRCFYLLSVCFTFSQKHFENMCCGRSNLLQLAEMAFKNTSYSSDADAARMKALQILQRENSNIDSKLDCKPIQISEIINSYFYISQRDSLSEIKKGIKTILEKYGDQVMASLAILGFIQFNISKGNKDIAQVLIEFSQKLIFLNSDIFSNSHPSFNEDLQIMQLEISDQGMKCMHPYDCLFQRSLEIRQLQETNIRLNLQYLIYNQYFHQDVDFNIDIIEDQLKFFDGQPSLIKLKQIYLLFMLLNKAIKGDGNIEEIEIYTKLTFPQVTSWSIIIKNLLARFYINMKDYELAKPYLDDIFNYLYTQEKLSYFLLYVNEEQCKITNNTSIYEKLHNQIQMVDIYYEETDELYLQLIDEQFAQEAIINYLDVLSNFNNGINYLPSVQELLSLLFKIKNQVTQQNLFKVLAQIFYCYSNPSGVEKIQAELENIYLDKITQFEEERNQLKEKMSKLFLTKQLNADESNKINSQINLYSFIIGIFESINKGLTQKTLLTWSISCAEKAIIGYKMITKTYQKHLHYQISELYLILIDCFRALEQTSTVILYLEACEDELMGWFKSAKHPWKGHFFMKKGLLLPWMYQQYIQYITILIKVPNFNRLEMYTIIRGILLQNRVLLQLFEQSVQGALTNEDLQKSLDSYLRMLDESQRIQMNPYTLYGGNDPELMLQQVTAISYYDFNSVNTLMDALSILQLFNQNNIFTQQLSQIIEQLTCS